MADLISRLKLESGEFDSKIKRAGQELLAYSEHCKKVGLQMGFANEDAKKFASALGSMATTSQTVRGKLNELTSTFTDLSVMYKNMTEQEKNSTFGKNLAASLDQLKTRINDTKAQLNDVSIELGNTKNAAGGAGSIVDELTSKFGLNIKQLAGWGAAAGAAKVAMDVLKDAFFQSEGNIDEWGRTVEGAKGAYDVFLNTLNSGNWSNFFTNLSTAVQGARDLYDALDRLGSVKSNNQAAIAIQQQQVAQLRLMKQLGQNVDNQLKAATERLAQLQKQAVDAGKMAGHTTILNTLQNRVNANNTTGVNISDGTLSGVAGAIENRGQEAFDQYKRQYEALTKKGLETVQKYDSLTKSYYDTQVFNLEKLTKDEQKRYLIAQAVTEGETEIQKGISLYAQAVNEGAAAAREEFKGNRYALQGAGGKGGKGTSPQEQAAKAVADALLAYEQAIKKAQMEFESGAISDADVKKKTLAAQENLWSAYGKAYKTYADPKYKEAQDAAATEIVKLGGEVKASTEAQKAAQKATQEQEAAARQLAAAEKKRAEELEKLKDSAVSAVRNNDLKAAYQVQSKALQGGMSADQVQLPVTFTYTQANLAAFTEKLKSDLATADVGSLNFNRIMGKMADANALGNFMQEAMKAGVDMAQLEEVGQTLWQKIFAEDADIPQDFWKQIFGELGNATGKDYQVGNDGSVTEKNDNSFNEIFKDFSSKLSSLGSSLNSVSSGLKNLGVTIPKEVDDVIGYIQAVSSVIQGVQTIISLFATSSQALNTAAVSSNTISLGVNTGMMAALIAALKINTATNFFGLANGGIVPAFAQGGLIGRAAGGLMIPGKSFSGDNLRMPVDGGRGWIGVNSGELILNKAQQDNLASQLADSAMGGINLSATISGEDIRLAMSNEADRWNNGEMVKSI